MEVSPTAAAIVASALGLGLGAWIALAVRRMRETWRARAHNARGRRAEKAAQKLLEARGYRVAAQQLRTSYAVQQGETEHAVELVIDFVVEHAGERFAAEVKSGGASGLERADTRRQLLEYQLALGSRRVLLVDPERQQITEFAFPIPRPAAPPARAKTRSPLAAAVLVLLAAAILVAVVVSRR
jgi:hypothetical protein